MHNGPKIAVVGCGLIGERHARVISEHAQMELAGIVEPSEQNRTAAKAFGVSVWNDLDALLNESTIDGVVLATPTTLHRDQALQCIEDRIPLLIEKPIAVTANDAKSITTAARSKSVNVLVGHHRRYNGMVRAAKQALESGSIGEIRAIQATCWFYKPDAYFDKAPWRKKIGAGPISVNLVHDVDLLRYFCGEVKSVQAVSVPSRRGFENEDLASAILTFSSGAVATITVSDSVVGPWSWELTTGENPVYPQTDQNCYLIGGSEGGLSLPSLQMWKHEDAPDWWTPIQKTTIPYENRDPLIVQMEHFAEVIGGRDRPLVSADEGAKSLEVVEAIALSARTGRAIDLKSAEDSSAQTGT